MTGTWTVPTATNGRPGNGHTPATNGHAAEQGDLLSALTTVATASDPNSSFELRDMVSVAASYFERGMIDDAEELIQEAIDAGYSRTDALDLSVRIQLARTSSEVADDSSSQIAEPIAPFATVNPDSFTTPLPGAETQPDVVRRAILESEGDIGAGRLQSALDASLNALSRAPRYLPLHIRLAELRHAMGDSDGALETLSLLRQCLALAEDAGDWLTLSMRVMLDATDIDAHAQLARALLNQRGAMQLEPFVPEAIERATENDPATALELATEYCELRPTDVYALTLRLRALVAAGNDEQIISVFRSDVRPEMAGDLLFMRSLTELANGRDAWIEWLGRMTAHLTRVPDDGARLGPVIQAGRRLVPNAQLALSIAVANVALQNWRGVLEALEPWMGQPTRETSDAREMLIAASARAVALRHLADPGAIEALTKAVGQAVVIDVRPFAESCQLFGRSIAADALMAELVAVARETSQSELAINHLQTLRDRMPEHLEIRTGLASLQVAAGRISEGVRELRYIAERYEQAGNFDRMAEAMRHMSDAVPNNHEIKAMLIESYIQRGIPDAATRELGLLGNLYLRRKRAVDAAAAFVRGAEIAATTGETALAVELFDRAVAADPDNVGTRHAAVAFFIMNGAVEQATPQLWHVVRVALEEDDPDEAVAALHQLIALAPSDPAAFHKLGEVLTSLGEYAQAERVYRRLAAFTPDDPVLIAKRAALSALAAEL